jgi:hypothetical protein
MGRSTLNRITRLEEAVAPQGRVHIVFGMKRAHLEQRLAEFDASRAAADGDTVLCIRWKEVGESDQIRSDVDG